MTPQEFLLEVIEQLQGTWRYRWLAGVATWIVCVLGWFYVYTIPDEYSASARVFVDTESLLRPLMQGLTAQQNTMNEVQLVSTAVLSRPNLETVAHETDLALRARSPADFETLITELQQQIRVSGGRDNTFTIGYEDNSREMARNVVDAVLTTFVEGAIGEQGDDAEITEKALAGEIREHEQRLNAADAALANFKRNNVGYMPDESGDYYTQLQTALAAATEKQTQIRQLQERHDELSRQIEGEEPVFGLVSVGGGAAVCAERAQISGLESQLSGLLVDFTEKHPRVLALKEQIAALEQRCASSGAPAASMPVGDDLELNPVYQNLRVQLSNTEVALVEARAQLRTHEATVTRLRTDVDRIAQVETELKQLNRDYAVIQTRHQELLRRWEDLQSKKRLDPVTDTVQFRIIEPPFALPQPVGPNRPLLLGAVLVFGLGLGGAAAFGMNFLSPSFFSRRSVGRISGLPVLGSVTMVLTPAGKARRRYAAAAWVASYGLLIVCTVAVVIFASRGSELLRAWMQQVVA